MMNGLNKRSPTVQPVVQYGMVDCLRTVADSKHAPMCVLRGLQKRAVCNVLAGFAKTCSVYLYVICI